MLDYMAVIEGFTRHGQIPNCALTLPNLVKSVQIYGNQKDNKAFILILLNFAGLTSGGVHSGGGPNSLVSLKYLLLRL